MTEPRIGEPGTASSSEMATPLAQTIRDLIPSGRPGAGLLQDIAGRHISKKDVLNENASLKLLRDSARSDGPAGAEAAARALVDNDPSRRRLIGLLGDIAAQAGRKEEAEGLYARALEGGNAGDPSVLRVYAQTLDDLKRPADRVEAAYRAAIIANPADRTLLGRWMTTLDRQGIEKRPALVDLQASTHDLIGSILITLIEGGDKAEELGPIFTERLARFRDGESFKTIDAIWTAFARLETLPPQALDRLRAALGSASLFYFLMREPPLRRYLIAVGSAWSEAKVEFGLKLGPVRRYLEERFLDTGANAWFGYLDDGAEFTSDLARRTILARERYCVYQEGAVAQRAMRFLHPVDGVEVEPIDSFVFNGRTVYTFPGSTAFLLITGGGGNKILCGFLPALNVLLDFNAQIRSPLADYALASLFGGMLKRLGEHAGRYEAARSAPARPAEPRAMCLTVGSAQNFAHHIWNFHTGFERLVRAGLAANVDEIYYTGSQFFGPVDELFPEFTNARFIEYPRGVLDPHPFSGQHVLIQPGGYFIPKTLKQRVTRVMRARAPADPKAVEPARDGERPFPIVWIGLRLGDKSWSGQETEVAAVIDRVVAAHPQALFLLDGFSYPVGTDDISGAWAPIIEALQQVAAAIVRNCRSPERVVNLIGNSLRESVLWASAVDLYVTPHGTSQHKVGWLTSAPGIIYSTKSLKDVCPELRPGSWESEGSSLPTYIFGEPADAITRRGVNDRREKIDNVSLDVDALVALMLDRIAQRACAAA